MAIVFQNNTAGSVTSGGTGTPSSGSSESWTVTTTTFPTALTSGTSSFHVVDPAQPTEKIKVTAITGSGPYTWTVTRGDESTTTVAHTAGFSVQQAVTAGEFSQFVISLTPSGDVTGVKDAANINNAVNSLPATGGVVRMAPTAQWYIECGQISINRSGVIIDATGCYINAVGAGDVFLMFDSSTYGSRTVNGGGIVGLPVIDGTSTTGNSSAVHGGDIFTMSVFVQPQNFVAGTTSKGVWMDNNYFWTEMLQADIRATNCSAHVVFDVHATAGTVTGSYDRGTIAIYVDQQGAANDGVVWQNGALMVDGKLTVRGNFNSSGSSLTSAAIKMIGQTPAGTALMSYSNISTSLFDVACECNSGSFTPQTIVFTNSFNQISNCYGQVDFGGAGNTFASSNNPNSFVTFYGPVTGDAALQTWLLTGFTNAWLGGSGQAITSVTPAAVTAMSGNLTGFTTYVIRAWIPYTSTSTVGVPKFAFTGPGQVNTRLTYKFYSATALVSVVQETDFTAVVSGPTLTSSTGLLMEVEGTIEPNGAGTLQLTAAEGTNLDTFNIALGAYMTCMPLQN